MNTTDVIPVDSRLRDEERQKWDDYYASQPMLEIDEATRAFGEELAERIDGLLPAGGTVLEAGCGGGWQSLILALQGKHRVTLMDFSNEALRYAARAFAGHNATAEFVCQDVFEPAEPQYDLVFNAGVLEHYTFDGQVAFLRGMASRSRKFVLALVPNRQCYWYWLWRLHRSGRGNWPFGKETPMDDLSAAFEAAGLRFLGHWFGGGRLSEFFIQDLAGVDDRLREEILTVHRSPVIPEKERAYLVAALGCKEGAAEVPGWMAAAGSGEFALDQLTASIADALAVVVDAGHRNRQLETSLLEQRQQVAAGLETLRQRAEENLQLRGELAAVGGCAAELEALRKSRAYRVSVAARRWRLRLLPPASRRESAARKLWRAAGRLRHPRAAAKWLPRAAFRRLPLRFQYRLRGALAALGGWRRRPRPLAALGGPVEPAEVRGLVSVVLPVYNHASLLRGAVESVLAQTYRDLELIIVNDGSSDGVEKVLADYAGDPRVRVLTQPNQTLPAALSNGFEFARGEFWTWTSADNLMGPEQLRRQVAFLRAHEDVAMVYADYTAMDARGKPLRDPGFRPHNRRTPDDPEIHLPDAEAFGQNADNFLGPCFLYRSWVGRLLGEYDPVQGIEDFDYWLRLSLVGRIAHLDTDELLYQYRVHQNSLSGRAEELKIPENAVELMGRHRARAEFAARPWTIHADAATLVWLDKIDASPHRVVPWSGEPLPAQADEKCLLLVHADSLPAAARCRLPSPCGRGVGGEGSAAPPPDALTLTLSQRARGPVVAAWFPADAFAPDRYRAESNGGADVCFADDDLTAARLGVLTRHVFRAAPGPTLLGLATRWANERTYYHRTHSTAERRRTLPRVFRRPGETTRVLLQADGFTQGGMEQVMLDLALCLRAEDFDVELLVLDEQGQDTAKMRQAGVPVLSLPAVNRADHYRRLLQDRRIDVVSAHYSLYGAEIAHGQGVPFVQTIHNTYIFLPPAGAAAYRANDPFTSAYVCVSQAAAHYSDVKLGLPVGKMLLVPNGIDMARLEAALGPGSRQALRRELGLGADDFVFLNVGSLQPIKCQATLVSAFAQLAREFPEAKLVLLGRAMIPAYLGEVQRAIARHGLQGSVLLAGHRDDAPRFYAAADAFVLPSLCEGWSLALAEAIAAGLPVVATSVGSAPDLLPQLGGQLVRPPFGAITNLDFLNLGKYAAVDDPAFTAELAAAMANVCRNRCRPAVSDVLRRSLDRREAYKPYAQLFLWLLQGGRSSAARPWAASRLASSQAPPLADLKAA